MSTFVALGGLGAIILFVLAALISVAPDMAAGDVHWWRVLGVVSIWVAAIGLFIVTWRTRQRGRTTRDVEQSRSSMPGA